MEGLYEYILGLSEKYMVNMRKELKAGPSVEFVILISPTNKRWCEECAEEEIQELVTDALLSIPEDFVLTGISIQWHIKNKDRPILEVRMRERGE